MAQNNIRGKQVLVRTAGGYPVIRRLWTILPTAALVAEEGAFRVLNENEDSPDLSLAVAVPPEDVFELPSDPESIDPGKPYDRWGQLTPLSPEGAS